MTELDFGASILARSDFSDKQKRQMFKRLKKIYGDDEQATQLNGISLDAFLRFHQFLSNVNEVNLPLTFYHLAGSNIDKQTFAHLVKTINGFQFDQQLLDVVFALFHLDDDESFSFDQFLQSVKQHSERGVDTHKDTQLMKLFSSIGLCAQRTFF